MRSLKIRRGFTLIELLCIIAIMAVMAALLFPVFAQVREKGRQAACLSNLRQIGLATRMYTDDYDGRYPYTVDALKKAIGTSFAPPELLPVLPEYPELLAPYLKSEAVLSCPSDTGWETSFSVALPPRNTFEAWGTSYKYHEEVAFYYPNVEAMNASRVPLFSDMSGLWHGNKQNLSLDDHVFQLVYLDMHVKRVPSIQLIKQAVDAVDGKDT